MKIITLTTFALLLSGCATAYQPYSYFGGGGYKEAQLSENSFKVTFEANGYTGKEQAADLALLRAADLTLENGFKYFVIVSSTDNSSAMTFSSPTTTTATVTGIGKTAYGTAQTYGGQTFHIALPTPSLTILCFRERPSVNGMIYDAAIASKSLKSQYGAK